jgi:hypothetical protein
LVIPDSVQIVRSRGDVSPKAEKIEPDSIEVLAESGCVAGSSWQDGAFALAVAGWNSTARAGARAGERFRLRVFDRSLQLTAQAFPEYVQCGTFRDGMQAICRDNGVYADHTVQFVRRLVLVPTHYSTTPKANGANPGTASLHASARGDAVHLEWAFDGSTTPPEVAVQRHVVSDSLRTHSEESGSWETIAIVGSSENRTKTGAGADAAQAGADSVPSGEAFVDDDLPEQAEEVVYRLRWGRQEAPIRYSNEVVVSRPAVERVTLSAPFPNPAAGRTTVRFALPEPAHVTLALYDLLGRRVGLLLQGRQPSGRKSISIDVSQFASGTYLFRLTASGNSRVRKLQIVE